MKNNLLIALIIILSQSAFGQKKRVYYADKDLAPRERFVDFTHLELQVEFEPENKLVKGKITHEFKVLRRKLDSLFLDGIKLRYKQVTLNGQEVKYKNTDQGITVYFNESLQWNEEHSLAIMYEANPRKGLYFVGWDDETQRNRKQIWTQGQGIDNRHWMPLYDERNEKIVSEIWITFDKGYEVLSNGELLEKNDGTINGKNIWHYEISHPHAPYLIMLGIGKYGIQEYTSASGIPLKLYYYPEQKDQIQPTYLHSVRMFDFFEKEIGVPYPWKTYSQIPVQDFMYGAMENTTATIFGDFYLVNSREFLDRNYVRVDAHELAHQWFGDMVTARSAAHHWLQESFATHYDLMYQKEAFGQDHFDWTRRDYNNQALGASLKDLKPVAHSEAGTVRHYPKGAHVLQMLKYVVGREQFNAAIKYYLEKHPYQNVDSDDLLTAFHEKLGLSLDWFWEQWIYKGGEPHYQVDFQSKKGKGTFRVEQVHDVEDLTSNFKMPIEFEVHYKDGSFDQRKVWIENDTTEVVFELGKRKVDYVLFDVNSQIMKNVSFPKSKEMLKAQAAKAKHMIDRYDAYVDLDTLKFKKKDQFFRDQFFKEEFHGVQSLLVKYFLREKNDFSNEVIKTALNHPSVEVRRTAVNFTAEWNETLAQDYEARLKDSSYAIIANALEILTVLNPTKVQNYLETTKEVMGNRSKNVRITWLKIATLVYRDKQYIDELVDYTSDSFEFLTRANAANALKDINLLNEKAIANMIDCLFHFNGRLRNPVRKVLDAFNEQEKYHNMIQSYIDTKQWDERGERVLKRFKK